MVWLRFAFAFFLVSVAIEREAPRARADLVSQPQLPSWVADVSPVGAMLEHEQIRIAFRKPLVANLANDIETRDRALAAFHLVPNAPGHFRFVTSRLVEFEERAPLAFVSRYRVTIDAGLRDIDGDALPDPLSWTFETPQLPIFASRAPAQMSVTGNSVEAGFWIHCNGVTIGDSLRNDFAFEHDGRYVPATSAIGANGCPAFVSARGLALDTDYAFVLVGGLHAPATNLPTAERVLARFRTVAPLRFERMTNVDIPDGSQRPVYFAGGTPALVFNGDVDGGSIAANVTLSPSLPLPAKAFSSDGAIVRIDPAQLQPNTTYSVRIGPGVLGASKQPVLAASTTFRTGAAVGTLVFPEGLTVLPLSAPAAIGVASSFSDGMLAFAERRLSDDDLVDVGLPSDAFPAFDSLSHMRVAPNHPTTVALEAPAVTGGVVAFVARGTAYAYRDEHDVSRVQHVEASGFLSRTNLGVYAESVGHAAMIRVSRLDTGEPVTDATVRLLPMRARGATAAPIADCAKGTTGPGGILLVPDVTARCASSRWWNGQLPKFTVLVRSGADWTFTPLGTVPGGFGAIRPEWFGSVGTDRGVYRPGDLLHLGGIITTMASGTIEPVTGHVQILLDDREVASATADRYGRIVAVLHVPSGSDAIGSHDLAVTTGSLERRVDASILIAEPRVPAFTNVLGRDREAYAPGDVAIVRSTVRSMTGERLAGARVAFSVEPHSVDIPANADAADALRDFHFDQYADRSHDEHAFRKQTATVTTSRNGTATLRVAIPSTFALPVEYHVTSDAVASNGEGSGAEMTFVTHRPRAYAGLALPKRASATEPLTSRVVAVSDAGRFVSGQRLVVALLRGTTILETRRVVSGSVPVDVTFPSAGEGSYRVEVRLENDVDGYVVASDIDATDGAPEPADSSAPNPASVNVDLDRTTYRSGERGRAFVQTPFRDADVLVEVVGNGVYWFSTRRVAGSGTVEFPIDAVTMPNAGLRVIAFRRGALPSERELGSSVASSELTPFSIDKRGRALSVDVTAHLIARTRVLPARGHVSIDVRTADGRAARAACVIAVVDDALLSLDGYRFPAALDAVYAPKPIEDVFADNRLHPALIPRGPSTISAGSMRIIGATSSRVTISAVEIRRALSEPVVSPIAYFDATKATDAHGRLTIDFPLPANATRWRVMVMSTADRTSFGNGEGTFVGSTPAIVATRVRFVRRGDTVARAEAPKPRDVLDAPAVPESPAVDRVLDAGTVTSVTDIVRGPLVASLSLVIRGAPWPELERDARRLAESRYFERDDGSGASFEAADRRFIENWNDKTYGYDTGGFHGTAYGAASRRAAHMKAALPAIVATLEAELHDPVAAGFCRAGDVGCVRTVEVFALDGLSASGSPSSEHLVDLIAHAPELDVALRLIVARLSLQQHVAYGEGLRLAEALDDEGYVGAESILSPGAMPERPRHFTQIEALRLALARGDSEDRVDAIVRGADRDTNDPFDNQSTSFGEAMVEYARHFPPAPRVVDVTTSAHTLAHVVIDAAHPAATIALPSLAAGDAIHLATTGGPASYELTTANPVTDRGSDDGIFLMRTVQAVKDDEHALEPAVLAAAELEPEPMLSLTLPQLVEVTLRITVDHPAANVEIVDPLPAGLEAVDRSLPIDRGITLDAPSDAAFSGGPRMLVNRVEAHIERCEAGSYVLRYLARVIAPGTFAWPGARAEAHDGSGDRGRTAATTVRVRR